MTALETAPTAIGDLVPHDGVLTPETCAAVARAVGSRRDLWADVPLTPTETGTRAYALVHETADVEVWVLAWRPGHTTGYHDHGGSNVGFCVAEGALTERELRFAAPPTERAIEAGGARAAGSDYIHYLEWRSGEPAISVHVYSPPLAVVGQYRIADGGVLRRETQSGRDELTLD